MYCIKKEYISHNCRRGDCLCFNAWDISVSRTEYFCLIGLLCGASPQVGVSLSNSGKSFAGVFRLVEHSSFHYNSHVLPENENALLAL